MSCLHRRLKMHGLAAAAGMFAVFCVVATAAAEGPEPLLFDVNAIKSLEAANPASGVPMPEGLEAGPFGSASFKINLKLPPGRGAAVPELALRYDSGGGGGLLGRGFDLGIPPITTDTRFGLPVHLYPINFEALYAQQLAQQQAQPAQALNS